MTSTTGKSMVGPSEILGFQRTPANGPEKAFFDAAKAAGWEVTKRGWPDFFCVKEGGRIALVEVKASFADDLKTEQREVMEALARYGVPCFVWSPDCGDPHRGFSRVFPPESEQATDSPQDFPL